MRWNQSKTSAPILSESSAAAIGGQGHGLERRFEDFGQERSVGPSIEREESAILRFRKSTACSISQSVARTRVCLDGREGRKRAIVYIHRDAQVREIGPT